MSRRVTMADVAREAGVSLMTVSRVVNGKGGISAATRERVQQIIDRLGYRPSNIARGLVTNRTGTIGLIVPDNSNPFFSEVARGAEREAYAKGYNVFLCNTEEDRQREHTVLRSLEEKRVDGIVLCSSRLTDSELHDVLTHHPAAVLINRPYASGGRFGLLHVDDELGGRLATQHLLESGHRAIGVLAGPDYSYSGQWRVQGYQATMQAAGLSPAPTWVQHCLPFVETGREAAQALLTAHPELTALYCYNDLVAVGAIQACVSLGRAIPGDVAIIGNDNIALAALVTPSLTTCHIPKQDLGSQAMRMLLSQIEDCPSGCENVVLPPELIVRASAP